MELLYSMRRKPLKCEPPQYESISDPEVTRPICTVSTANIIAFTSMTELSDVEGDTWGGHVYVCDLDTPWDSHKVTSTTHPVSALEWDEEGKQLLVATTVGEVSVYGQKEHLLNDWSCLYKASFPGEHIIAAVFFHGGRRVELVEGKKPDAPVTEKVKLVAAVPTLKGFGGAGLPGACVVSAGGAACALAAGAQHATRGLHHHVSAAAMFTTHSGKIVVAGIAGSRVRCASLTVARGRVQAVPLPTLCLPDDVQPTCVSWSRRDGGEVLLVAGKTVAVWRLTERVMPLHQRLLPVAGTAPAPGIKPSTECFNTLVWQQTGSWSIPPSAGPARAAAWRPPAGPPLLITSRALHLADAQMVSVPIATGGGAGAGGGAAEAPGTSPPKKAKYAPGCLTAGGTRACCVASSRLGGVAVCVDSLAQLHVYRATTLSLPQALTLLEYSLVTGYDCLDVLLATQQVELLHDRITESFQRQPAAFQQYYYQSWLCLRASLCRMSAGLASSASALAQHQSLLGVWAALGGDESLLDDPADDKQPDAAPALQPLRAALQRALHCAATALQGVNTASTGYELLNEPSALALLRKLVSLARGITRAGDALLRPLARLATCKPPPQDLIEECLVAAAQTGAPRVWEALPRRSVSAPHGRPYPLYLEYGVEPEPLFYNPEPPASQCDNPPTGPMDSIRYMYIGGGRGPAKWRQCSRCGARAFATAHAARHPLQRAYDARYLPTCRCGGKWTLYSNL